MNSKYRVRFANNNNSTGISGSASLIHAETPSRIIAPNPQQQELQEPQGRRARKSKFGCKECKLRRVKCDETFPVCIRCQRRGSICLPLAPPPMQWQAETPWTLTRPPTEPWTGSGIVPDKKLLYYWLENGSRMMTIILDNNPLSFPLVEHLLHTPSLVHAVQSVSAGQQGFFHQSALQTCLRERGLAFEALRRELLDPAQVKPSSILTVFLLGISSSWSEDRPRCYGKEHLFGARTLLGMVLTDEKKRDDPGIQYLLGWYLYWDTSCAFVADPDDAEVSPLNTFEILATVENARDSFHPMVGFSAKLFYHLACLGRYCRRVMQTGVKDPDLESALEKEFLSWDPEHEDDTLIDLSIAYRNHGLIMLYEICGQPQQPGGIGACLGQAAGEESDSKRSLALDSLGRLLRTSVDADCINFHSMPLLTAAGQLKQSDTVMRVKVISRFKALYSTTRVMVDLWAIELLEELWGLRDGGAAVSWLELLLSKGWALNFA